MPASPGALSILPALRVLVKEGEKGEQYGRSDLILPCPVDSTGNQGKFRTNLRSGLHLRARTGGTRSKFTQCGNKYTGQLHTPWPSWPAVKTTFSPWTCISPKDLLPSDLGPNFANTGKCRGGKQGLGVNNHYYPFNKPLLNPHHVPSTMLAPGDRNKINMSLLVRCLKAI